MYQYNRFYFNARLGTIATKLLYLANLKLFPSYSPSFLPRTLLSTTSPCLYRLDYCNSSWNQKPRVCVFGLASMAK